jgi:hypothetical protein
VSTVEQPEEPTERVYPPDEAIKRADRCQIATASSSKMSPTKSGRRSKRRSLTHE